MRRLLQALRLSVAFGLFFLELTFVTWPHLYWTLARATWRGLSPRQRRGAVWAWQYHWARHFFGWTNRLLGVTARFEVEGAAQAAIANDNEPLIVLCNHQSYADVLLIFVVMRGKPMLWSGKKILRWMPAAGKSAEVIRVAFLERGGTAADRARVAEAAQFARADGASFMLFPEGHRWRRKYLTPGFTKVLLPHVGGFAILLDELSGYPVLDLTLKRTATELGGTDVVVHGRLRSVPDGCTTRQQRQDLINAWWREKDQLLN